MEMVLVFIFNVCLDNIVIIIIDVLDEKMNILKVEFVLQVCVIIK